MSPIPYNPSVQEHEAGSILIKKHNLQSHLHLLLFLRSPQWVYFFSRKTNVRSSKRSVFFFVLFHRPVIKQHKSFKDQMVENYYNKLFYSYVSRSFLLKFSRQITYSFKEDKFIWRVKLVSSKAVTEVTGNRMFSLEWHEA